jgi:hypothetical protein
MALMYRLFGTTKYRRWFIIFLMTQTIVINLVTAITIFTQCPNVRSLWDPVNFPGKCWSPLVQEYTGFFQGCKILLGIQEGKLTNDRHYQPAMPQLTLH